MILDIDTTISIHGQSMCGYYETFRYCESNIEFELGFTNWISFTSKSHVSHNTLYLNLANALQINMLDQFNTKGYFLQL